MDLATLKPAAGARKKRKRVGLGRGCTRGKTCGRGHKGQKARSGYSRPPGFEGGQMPLHRRLPKRGFRHRDRHPQAIVNVDALMRVFDEGAEVSAEAIVQAGLADAVPGGVKVLGRGEATKALNVTVHAVTASARAKIEAAGGRVTLLDIGTKGPKHKRRTDAGAALDGREEA
ncbi:MAG TPA: 50S ribosomal protein L15 [Candidatus Hydrogenedentes bacterium]|nr:50S ribosomal protein L15 [Candidatus Hydrogenedentota bacterium]